MGKFSATQTALGIAFGVVLGILIILIFFVLAGLFQIAFNKIGAMITAGVLALIVSVFFVALYLSDKKFAKTDEGKNKFSVENFFAERLKERKPVHIATAILCQLPNLVISAIVFFFLIIGDMDGMETAMEGLGVAVYSAGTAFAVFNVIYFFAFLFYFIGRTCPKCKCVFSLVDIKLIDFHSRSWDEEKTKTYSENVGGVYIKDGALNKKVADIYRDREYSYTVHNWSSHKKYQGKCVYCERLSEIDEYDSFSYKK